MIELINLSKIYYQRDLAFEALKNVSLTVNHNEIVGVIGKSGAGKSTLIRCVNLLERPTSGTVRVAGQDLTAMSTAALRHARLQMGMIFQQFNLLSARTVFDNIALPLRLAGIKKTEITKKINPLLDLVGLADKKNNFPAQLSGGQKQRVAIARALVMQPNIVLCDEATSSLDPQNTESVLNLLREINQQLKLTILLITHEMHVIKQICDRVIVLDEGKIIEQGSVADIFAYPKMAVTQYFVDSALKAELPILLKEKISDKPQLNSIPVWRIYFRGHAAAEPIIAQLAKEYGLTLNILQANLECIQHFTIGIMVASIESIDANMSQGLQFLANKGLQVETIGYVARDAI